MTAPLHFRKARVALHALFFASGAAGLGYQMAWSRMFTAGLGHEMPAVLAVIAALFGGMALGAWLVDRPWPHVVHPPAGLPSTVQSPGRQYAALELLIGLWGFLSILLIPWANAAALRWTGLDPLAARQWLIAFVVPALVLLPATAAMGATFPVMVRFVAASSGLGRSIGGLYAVNTLGAVAGVAGSTFLLLPAAGFRLSLAAFAGVNVFCALGAFVLQREASAPSSAQGFSMARLSRRTVGATLFATGLLAIGYEVLGVRALREVLENTIYTYASALCVYLAGTAAGAALYQKRPSWARLSPRVFLLATCLACALGEALLSQADRIYLLALGTMRPAPGGVVVAELFTAACVFALPTLCMGATFSRLLELGQADGLGLGRGLAVNTLGSALAPWLFGVVLLPRVDIKWSFGAIGACYVILAGLPLPTERNGRTPADKRWRAPLLAAAATAAVLLLSPPLRFLHLLPTDRLLHYDRGTMESVAVIQHFDQNRSLLVNNRFSMGGTGSTLAERRHASIPLLLHPHPRRALFLGLGTGITFAGAGPHPELEAEAVELLPEIVGAQPWFQPQNALPADAGPFRIHVADARRFVRVTPERYDVIVADLFHPAKDGAGTLYAVEHYRMMRDRLRPEGIACQWLPLFQLDEPMLRVITRTFLQVFPDARAFLLRFNIDTPVLGLISGAPVHGFHPDYLAQRVRDPQLRERLDAEQLRDAFQLFGCALASPEQLRAFAADARINTDDHPVVMFRAPELRVTTGREPYALLLRLIDLWPPEVNDLGATRGSEAVELAGFIRARNTYLKGLVAEAQGQEAQAIDRFVESAATSSHFSIGYAHALTLATRKAKTQPEISRKLLERLDQAQPERPVARQLLNRLFPAQ